MRRRVAAGLILLMTASALSGCLLVPADDGHNRGDYHDRDQREHHGDHHDHHDQDEHGERGEYH